MQLNSCVLAELGNLEEKLHDIFLILPEAAMRREEASQRSPHLRSDFMEWDAYCRSLEREVHGLLRRLETYLRIIHWKGASLPSPFYADLWVLWWQTVKRAAAKRQASQGDSVKGPRIVA
jgi:hypothetical protein